MLGPPVNNTKTEINDILFDFKINKDDLTDHFYDSVIPKEVGKGKAIKIGPRVYGKNAISRY